MMQVPRCKTNEAMVKLTSENLEVGVLIDGRQKVPLIQSDHQGVYDSSLCETHLSPFAVAEELDDLF